MADILTQEEIDLLLQECEDYEESYYSELSTEAFAVCIIQKVNDKITEYILRNGKSPTSYTICNYYYDSTNELFTYLCERKDIDKILKLVNDNISNYKCEIKLYISEASGELKKYYM